MGWLFAKLYDRVSRQTEEAGVREWRTQLLGQVGARVLELGSGTGINLPLYPASARDVLLTEPDRHMRARLEQRAQELGREGFRVADAGAERLPVDDASVDTVVSTLVLCTVPDPAASLAETMRVLRPGGSLLFLEHVAHDDPRLFRWQQRIQPFWKWFAEGCHTTRRTEQLIRDAGFEIESLTTDDLPKAPFWVRPTIRGTARKPE